MFWRLSACVLFLCCAYLAVIFPLSIVCPLYNYIYVILVFSSFKFMEMLFSSKPHLIKTLSGSKEQKIPYQNGTCMQMHIHVHMHSNGKIFSHCQSFICLHLLQKSFVNFPHYIFTMHDVIDFSNWIIPSSFQELGRMIRLFTAGCGLWPNKTRTLALW